MSSSALGTGVVSGHKGDVESRILFFFFLSLPPLRLPCPPKKSLEGQLTKTALLRVKFGAIVGLNPRFGSVPLDTHPLERPLCCAKIKKRHSGTRTRSLAALVTTKPPLNRNCE